MRVWDRLYPEWLPAMGKNPKADPEKDIAPMTPTQSAEYVIRRYVIDHCNYALYFAFITIITAVYRYYLFNDYLQSA
jgi:hypothetical protein